MSLGQKPLSLIRSRQRVQPCRSFLQSLFGRYGWICNDPFFILLSSSSIQCWQQWFSCLTGLLFKNSGQATWLPYISGSRIWVPWLHAGRKAPTSLQTVSLTWQPGCNSKAWMLISSRSAGLQHILHMAESAPYACIAAA
jgi:hypothetical protein